MADRPGAELTDLLRDWSNGDVDARDAVADIVYRELRRLASAYMRRERFDHTLQPTALVHEAYLRLVDQRAEWKSRAHFFSTAAFMMRRILVDHAKQHLAAKRGSGLAKSSLDEGLRVAGETPVDLIALNDALDSLSRIDPQRGQIVELRFFGGLSNEESAEVLGISPATVQRQWAGARAWLFHEMSAQGPR
ncbi:MAG TPA: sigma-70 family RNA polymerase sigma factor [Terracidiphilus sp.]|nr:sigma-70 family RNA polymerase sigma factor [Terracidiphilus sp.]